MNSISISKNFFNILLIIFLANFFLFPKIILAEDFENINFQEEMGKYLELPREDAQNLIYTLKQALTTEGIYLWSSSYTTDEQIAAAVILLNVVKVEVLNHLLVDAPIEVSWGIIKNTTKIARVFLTQDPTVVLEELEKESVKKAIGYGTKVLLQNEIRITPGAIKLRYFSYKGGEKEAIFQYVIVYKPIDDKKGKVEIRFYSPGPIEPPDPEKFSKQLPIPNLYQNLPPFIVEIKGVVEKTQLDTYRWIEGPSVKIDFSQPVPDLGIKPLSFWERQIWKPIIAQVKEVEVIITKVTGKSLGIAEMAVGAWDKIKSNFSKISNFLSGSIGQIPTEKSSPQPSPPSEETKSVDVKPQQGESRQPKPLGFEELQKKLTETSTTSEALSKKVNELPQQLEEEIKEEKKEEIQAEVQKETKKEEAQITICQKKANDYPLRNKIIFNEITWMGTANSANDEWIELKNISGGQIDLAGWQLLDKDSQIKIIFGGERVSAISANGFLLLERTNDDSAPGAAADLIYTGGLNNNDEALYFFDKNCQLQDEVLANPDWPAGDNSSKRTMERPPTINWWGVTWQTSLSPGGTPKKENSAGYAAIVSGGGGGGVSSSPPAQQETNPQITLSFPSQNPVNKEIEVTLSASNLKSATYDVKISIEQGTSTLSEICPNISGVCQENDWQSSHRYATSVFSGTSFSGSFKLRIQQDKKYFPGEANIVAKIRQSDNEKIVSEFKGKINITNPQENPAQNHPPTAFFVFSPKNPVIGDLISFDAGNSTDTDGAIGSYFWDFGDGTSAGVTTTHFFLTSGTSTVILLVTDNQGATSSTSTIIEISANSPVVPPTHILITEVRAVGTEEFVEIYNPTDEATPTSGWYLSYFPADNDWNEPYINKSFPTTTIAARGYFLIGFGDYNDPKMDWKADGRNLSNEAGAIGVFSSNPATTTTSTEAIERVKAFKIDVLGWGNTIVREETSVQSTSSPMSFARKIAATSEGVLTYIDSDNNSQDFEIQDPTAKARNQHQFSDLDGDGIIDSYDSTTTIATTTELKAGEYKFRDLAIIQGGKLVLNSSTTLPEFKGVKIAAENLLVDASSSISADAKGYSSNEGPSSGSNGSGAGYGGKGGDLGNFLGGRVYGFLEQPTDLGSGGGDAGRPGGAGGGVVWFTINNALIIDGLISANGENGLSRTESLPATGGGSGGSIYIETNNFSGSGKITANGGDTDSAGAGGGGRIAIIYGLKDGFSGAIRAWGGKFYWGGSSGGAGTIYLKQKDQSYGDLIIDNNGKSGATELSEASSTFKLLSIANYARLYFAGNLTAENLQIKNNSVLETATSSQITVNQDFIIEEKSSLISPSLIFLAINVNNDLLIKNESKLIGNFNIQTENLTLATSSLISANGKGYLSNQGPGRGGLGGSGAGGSYGGVGGNNLATSTYGSSTQPTDFGSGGGDTGRPGGAGGGAVWLKIENSLIIDGLISANGENGLSRTESLPATGGGSGGSIYIETNNFSGSGKITANGGDTDSAGAGGGGRIAIHHSINEFAGEVQVFGGKYYWGGSNGGHGTIYLQNLSGEGELITTGIFPEM